MGDLGQIMFFSSRIRTKTVGLVLRHFHLPGSCGTNFSFDDVHNTGARVIAKAAKEAGVKRMIHVLALNASEDSPSKFLQSKACGEAAVREEFPDATIL
ncbi:unnamed protein product [Porites evermanni]|uniref:NADH dehydrogenase [ubiquinone] 1 alpha subcomplex subunit 9, mitochondrial n=1 Tax=Porites evermanni TaxID=104178 RepID=A0ABN8RXA5_9CNID|nr:unnamed protein product [Porites evermanni]